MAWRPCVGMDQNGFFLDIFAPPQSSYRGVTVDGTDERLVVKPNLPTARRASATGLSCACQWCIGAQTSISPPLQDLVRFSRGTPRAGPHITPKKVHSTSRRKLTCYSTALLRTSAGPAAGSRLCGRRASLSSSSVRWAKKAARDRRRNSLASLRWTSSYSGACYRSGGATATCLRTSRRARRRRLTTTGERLRKKFLLRYMVAGWPGNPPDAVAACLRTSYPPPSTAPGRRPRCTSRRSSG